MSRPADNFEVRVVSWFYRDLETAVELIQRSGHKAVGYTIEDGALTIHRGGKKAKDFPVPLGTFALTQMVWGWLHDQEYPEAPTIDGNCSKGFCIETTGRSGWDYDYFQVKPCWMEHSK